MNCIYIEISLYLIEFIEIIFEYPSVVFLSINQNTLAIIYDSLYSFFLLKNINVGCSTELRN